MTKISDQDRSFLSNVSNLLDLPALSQGRVYIGSVGFNPHIPGGHTSLLMLLGEIICLIFEYVYFIQQLLRLWVVILYHNDSLDFGMHTFEGHNIKS